MVIDFISIWVKNSPEELHTWVIHFQRNCYRKVGAPLKVIWRSHFFITKTAKLLKYDRVGKNQYLQFITNFVTCSIISGGFRGGDPSPFLPKLYHLMLVKLHIWDPKYLKFFAVSGVGPLPGAYPPPFFKISGSATDNYEAWLYIFLYDHISIIASFLRKTRQNFAQS
jgi:hypothetical protein